MSSMVVSIRRYKFNLYILIFLYVYNIGIFFLPDFLKSRLIIGLLGSCYYAYNHTFHKKIRNIIFFYIIFLFLSAIVSVCNSKFDTWFIIYIVRNVLYLLGAAYLMEIILCRYKFGINQLLYAILAAILFNNVVSFLGVLFPSLQRVLVDVQGLSNIDLIKAMMDGHGRSIGFGDGTFFFGGAFSGVGLIVTVYLRKIGFLHEIRALLYFVVLLVTGVFLARTTLIGLIGILFLLGGKRQERHRCFRFFFNALILASVTIGCLMIFAKDILNIGWALEIFISYFDNGSLETSSTNQLKTMFVYPETFKTYLIGDALFESSSGAYYMDTDVGYLRLLYYWGVGGIILFWLFQFYVYWSLYLLSSKDKNILSLLCIVLFYIIVLNIKGFYEVNYLVFLLLGFYVSKYKSYEYSFSD